MNRTSWVSALRLTLAATILLTALLPMTARSLSIFAGLSALQVWWVVMCIIGLAMCVATAGTAWRCAGLVVASLLVGTSSQLGITVPIWFQEIRIEFATKFHIALFLAIAAQATLAGYVLFTRKLVRSAADRVKSLGSGRIAVLVIVLIALSATALPEIAAEDLIGGVKRFAAAATFLLINIGTILALAATLPDRSVAPGTGLLGGRISFPGLTPQARTLDRPLPYLVAIWVLIVSGLICVVAFERMVHLGDELAYVLQARYFLLGRLTAEIPSVALVPAFDYLNFTSVGDKYFSSFPPGWPLVLTLGAALRLEWLVNPVLGGVSILLAHALFRRETDRATANVVVLLMAVSPWFLGMSASMMSHVATLALWLAACLLLSLAREAQSARAPLLALAAGLLMGLLFLARPLDGLVMGVLTGLWSLRCLADRGGWLIVAAYGLGCLAVGSLVFPYNAYLTGDPFRTPIDAFFDKRWGSHRPQLGFGDNVGPPKPWRGVDVAKGHSPVEAAINAQHNGYVLNFELFGWGVGSLSLFLVHVLWGRWSRADRYMLAIIASILFAYAFYWYSDGFHMGPRYWFMTFLPFVALTASGIATLAGKIQTTANGTEAARKAVCVVAVLCAVAMVSFLSWRGVAKFFELRSYHSDYLALLKTHDLGNGIVFISNATPAEIGSASFFNPTRLDSNAPIFVRDLGPASNRAVAAAFPGRPLYFAVARAADGTKARIVKGPIAADALP